MARGMPRPFAVALAATWLFAAGPAAANDLGSEVSVACADNTCDPPIPPASQSTSDSTPLSVGDAYGSAAAQATYGILSASGWGKLTDSTGTGVAGTDASGGSFFDDTITLSGGTGTATITVTMFVAGFMQLSGTPASGLFEGELDVGSQSAFVHLATGPGGPYVQVICPGQSATWTSADGSFTCGADVPLTLSQAPTVTGDLVATFSVPYGEAVPIGASISAEGALQVQTHAVAVVGISVPANAAFVSESGSTYPPPKPAPLPESASAVLGCLLLAGGSSAVVRRRRGPAV